MAKREDVLKALLICSDNNIECNECPYQNQRGECMDVMMKDAYELLKDTTNPKNVGCHSCKHDAETGGSYCAEHYRCNVCGCCSGYEKMEDAP